MEVRLMTTPLIFLRRTTVATRDVVTDVVLRAATGAHRAACRGSYSSSSSRQTSSPLASSTLRTIASARPCTSCTRRLYRSALFCWPTALRSRYSTG
eukprot:4506941-Heterocapsa_arctica.AAC.1